MRVTRARGRYDLSVTVQAPGHEEHGDTKGAKGIATSEAALGQGITRALEWCEHNINIKECRINL